MSSLNASCVENMHLIQLEKPQQCSKCNALCSPSAAKPVRRVLNLTFPSWINPHTFNQLITKADVKHSNDL